VETDMTFSSFAAAAELPRKKQENSPPIVVQEAWESEGTAAGSPELTSKCNDSEGR
jgi:hypothetical protein